MSNTAAVFLLLAFVCVICTVFAGAAKLCDWLDDRGERKMGERWVDSKMIREVYRRAR
jgi:hypothetical protein